MKKSSLTARDKYLRKNFEITEEEYKAQLVKQFSGCRICGKTHNKKGEPLVFSVDHDHAVEKSKILSTKLNTEKAWYAWSIICPSVNAKGRTKSEAMALVRKGLKRLSVRGILCWKCNTALKKFNDDAWLMNKSSEYIERYRELFLKNKNGFGREL